MMSERMLSAVQDFDVAIANTKRKREAAYRLRYQVYCIERGYEPGEGTLETDRFDRRAGHALLTQRNTGQVVGTVRVVAPAAPGVQADLPLQHLCGKQIASVLPLGRFGEISRFAISKDLRERSALDGVPLRLGLMRGIVELSAQMHLTHWCAIMERTLLRLLRASGVHFEPIGPAIEYRGVRQPSWGRIDDVLNRMRAERYAVWDYVTNGGSLWRSGVPAELA